MKRESLYFVAPGRVEIRENTLPRPTANQLLIETVYSAISAGTEMLIYRGQVGREMAIDETIGVLGGSFNFPLKYGYATVGRVIAVGPGVDEGWHGRLVFCFNPHESRFVAGVGDVQPLPPDTAPETAVFLPNMETAVSFVMDGRPIIGERVVVFGQGIVGLLTTALLARFSLACLVTFDRFPLRREWSLRLGNQEVVQVALDPAIPTALDEARELLQTDDSTAGADLVYELSGNPQALNQAIALTGDHGRIVIGSWYGEKKTELDLGGRFHRSHIQLISSQVSRLAPQWSGRWTKSRRLDVAWKMLRHGRLGNGRPERLITHRFHFTQAAEAYRLLDESPAEALQVVLTY
jgi:2-desacetyl-2-hydroxyethyl bacteriochlorophyllide A dehydrogenase